MKKKVFSVMTAAALVFSLTACSTNAKTEEPETAAQSSASQTEAAGAETAESSGGASAEAGEKAASGETKAAGDTFTVGFDQDFPPMGFVGDDGEYTGFDLELAAEVADRLGLTFVPQPIAWDAKNMELESGNIDCIWNGMTITPELQEALTISDPYIKNYQVVVIRSDNADVYTSTADLVGKTVEAEAGSAGEAAIIGEGADESLKQAEYISAAKQTDTLLEVKTGAADAAVLDFVLAGAMVGQGDYSDLMIIPDLQLSVEEYGVGFRKDSDAAEKVNEAMQALIEDGTLNTLAEKYDLAELLLANQ